MIRAKEFVNAIKRIGVWAGSLLVAVSVFSLLLTLAFGGIRNLNIAGTLFMFRVTMTFAVPVWCVCLPWVIALKNAENRRMKTILVSGTLIGPASMGCRGLILQLKGGDPHTIWAGDPLIGMGGIAAIVFAFVVGSLTTCLYVMALKILCRESLLQ